MTKPPITLVGISEYTADVDWGDSEGLPVIPDEIMNRAEILLKCSYKGEQRRPPPPGDFDVDTTCRCGTHIVKRNSAPKHAIALCLECWVKETKR